MSFSQKNRVYYWQRYQIPLFLIIIIGLGFFLRLYEIGDWLHFELDQARDARVIDRALEGNPLDLPLLGPKAGGTFLRLGPGFYYLEYIGALLFNNAALGSAMVVALASTASIFLFFLFIKPLFASWMSLALTLLFSVSPYLVLYGRFAWNPNFMPFFALLGLYALLRAVDQEEKYQGRWLMLSFVALGLGTQMHFLAFLALPTIAFLFLIIKRPKIALKFWLGAFGIVAVLYLPMTLNEVATGGLNTQEFFGALSEKSTKEDHPLIEKMVRNVSEFGLHGIVILSGFEGATFPAIVIQKGTLGSVCDAKCDRGKWYGVLGIVLLGLASILLLKRFLTEKNKQATDVLLLSLLWLGVTFILFLPLSYGIAPRFFLLNAPLFFVLLGVLLVSLQDIFWRDKKNRYIFACLVMIGLIALNGYFLVKRFSELARAGTQAIESAPDRILKERVRVTYEQELALIDFLEEQATLKGGVPIYMFSEPQYRRALKYLLEQRGLENDVLGFSGIYRQGVYFLIIRTQSNVENGLKKYMESYTVGTTTSFGTLIAIELFPKPEAIMGERQDFSIEEKTSASKAPPRYTLREFLTRNDAKEKEDGEDELLNEE